MPRKPRMDPSGGVHHVDNSSARRYDCFLDDGDRRFFLRLLAEATVRFETVVLAFCLMGNHYHLLLHCPAGGLSATMKFVSENYTRGFNKSHGYNGALFADRFFSKQIDNDEYLLNASRYIHRNPLELGLKIDPYPWSSYPIYTGRLPSPHWISTKQTLRLIGGVDNYRRFVDTDAPTDKAPLVMGTRVFEEQPRLTQPTPSFDPVDNVVVSTLGCTPQEIQQGTKGQRNEARLLAILLANDTRIYSGSDIAAHYGLTSAASVRSTVARARRAVNKSPDLHRSWAAASAKLSARCLTPCT